MRNTQRRFLTVYLDPKTGSERLGTGADAGCFHHYVSAENVIRFGLRNEAFPAGQYNIYSWPEGGGYEPKFLMTAYKRV